MSAPILRLATRTNSINRLSHRALRSSSLLANRAVQEFPDQKHDNSLPVDHFLVLPEPITDQEPNELLRIPRRGEPETDFNKITTESAFKGASAAICDFRDFTTDINNSHIPLEKSLGEFVNDIARHLLPLDTALFNLIVLMGAKPGEYDHQEIRQVIANYYKTRDIRFQGNFKEYVRDYILRNRSKSSTAVDKRILSYYNTLGQDVRKLRQEDESVLGLIRSHLGSDTKIFRSNLNETNKLFSHTVDDPDILAVVSSELEDCQGLHHKERTPLKITPSTYDRFMQVCPDRFVRQTLWESYNKRCSPKSTTRYNNLSVIQNIRIHRKKIADLLGYRNHFEYKLEHSMVKSRREVLDTLAYLHKDNQPEIQKLLDELNEFAAENNFEDPSGLGIQEYDVEHWIHRYTHENMIGKSESELKAFFPLDVVLKGVMSYFRDYHAIDIKQVPNENRLWSKDVRHFEISKNGEHQGTIYYDPFRTESQQQTSNFYSRLRGRDGTGETLPLRLASTAFHRNPSTGHAYLSPIEVINLFSLHAVVIQRLLYNYPYYELNLYGCLETEAIDLFPNLCISHLLTNPKILQSCSMRPGSKPIDTELVKKIVGALTYFRPLRRWHSLYLAHLDVELHTNLRDTTWVVNEVYSKYSPFAREKDNYDYCAMANIFAGPQAGSIYSDLWAKQLANFCLKHSMASSKEPDQTPTPELVKEFNIKLLDSLLSYDDLDTSKKLLALTDHGFESLETGLGML